MPSTQFEPDTDLIKLYEKWLENFDVGHARQWHKLCCNDLEAAMCEAKFWRLLTDCGVEVKPNTDLTGRKRAPDFKCKKAGTTFYLEATCMRIDTVTNATGLSPSKTCGSHALLTRKITQECINKTPQCADLDNPCLLGIGTFHYPASGLCFTKRRVEEILTGETGFAVRLDLEKGERVGEFYPYTSLKSAAFLRRSTGANIDTCRNPLSGLLLGGFGYEIPRVYGVLHPEAVRPFDPNLLNRISFCRLATGERHGSLSTEWEGGVG